MKYQKILDVWALTHEQIAKLQPGQWVKAGASDTQRGVYLGTKPSGTVVVAWYGNAKGHNYRAYIQTLRAYARAI